MNVIKLDIGGTGIKYLVEAHKDTEAIIEYGKLQCLTEDDDNFEQIKVRHDDLETIIVEYAILWRHKYAINYVLISTAGNVCGTNIFRWNRSYALLRMLKLQGFRVAAINDAEAHMQYCLMTYPRELYDIYPAVCVALGTGVAMMLVASDGKPVRISDRHLNVDNMYKSEMRNVHDLLGVRGFKTCADYGNHLCNFLNLCIDIFNIRTVFLGGGIISCCASEDITSFEENINAKLIIIPADAALHGLR